MQYTIIAKATIEKGWHVYGLKKVEGPVPTSIQTTPHPLVIIDVAPKEIGKKISKYESIFSTDVEYFENTVTIIQPIQLKTKAKITLMGNLQYMACDNTKCTPPKKIPFSFSIQ